jgi:hypothetical protein
MRAQLKLADHWRHDGGVHAKRRLVFLASVALKQCLAIDGRSHPGDERAA